MEIAGIQLFPFIGFVLTIVSFVFDIIGFAAPYWWKLDKWDSYGGIWRQCTASVCINTSDSPEGTEAYLKAVKAMETLGLICLIAALVVVIVKLFVMKDKPILKWVAVGCLSAAAVFILIGVFVFVGKATTDVKENLHYAFAIIIVGAVGAIAAAVMFCLDKQE